MSWRLLGQSFDVASVKPSPEPPNGLWQYRSTGGPGTNDPTLFTCQSFSIAYLTQMAYGISSYLVSAPTWTQDKKFDIVAKIPEGATKEQFRIMLQNLLAERFKLVAHWEKKEIPLYELVIAKNGSKLREAREPEERTDTPPFPDGMKKDGDGFPILPRGQTAYAISNEKATLRGSGETMEHFASTLAGQLHEPVIDATGLKGKYDFTLTWLPGDFPREDQSGSTLQNALPQQLGLILKHTRGPMQILVVDQVEKTPSEN